MAGNPFDVPLDGTPMTVERPDGTRLHTVVLGSGPRTVMLAHGYGGSQKGWNVVGAALAQQGFRVIAFDQRGHGQSTVGSDGVGTSQMASDYAAILAAHEARDAILVGHSMGGFLSIAFLLDHDGRERVGGLLLMATFAGDVGRNNPQNKLQIPLIRSGVLVRLLALRPVAVGFTRSLVGVPFDKRYVDPFVDTFRSQDHRRLVPILTALVEENRYDRLGELTLPTTVVVGSRDRTTPPFHTADLHAGIEGSRLVEVPDKGHFLNWEASDTIVAEIAALADRL